MTAVVGYLANSASAQEQFRPFFVDPALPTAIVLDGEIDIRAALSFKRALAAAPNAQLVILNSPGGLIQIALLIAEEVHERGLSTFVPEAATCASACSIIFFAGSERLAAGKLGVHQISQASPDVESAQVTLSDIIEVLEKYGTSTHVLTRMLRTPPHEMHYFSKEELASLSINRISVSSGETKSAAPASAAQVPDRGTAGLPGVTNPFDEMSIERLLQSLE